MKGVPMHLHATPCLTPSRPPRSYMKGVPMADDDLIPVLVDIVMDKFGGEKKGKRYALKSFFKNLVGA